MLTRRSIILLVVMAGSIIETVAQDRHEVLFNWEVAAELPPSPGQQQALGFAGPVAGISNNVLLVAGGANFPAGMPWEGGKKKYYADLFAYSLKHDKLELLKTNYKLNETIAYAASCTTAQGVLYAGGENENGISSRVWLLSWDTNAQKPIVKEMPRLPVALTNAAITNYNNTVYLAGGEMADTVSNHFYCLDLDRLADGWKELPALPIAVSHAVMVTVITGKNPIIYIAGGRKKNNNGISDLYNKLYGFDINQRKWTERKSLPSALMAGTGISYGSADVLLFGGDTGKQFHEAEVLAQAISKTEDSIARQKLIDQKNKLQAGHPGFSKTILFYNSHKDEWISAGEMKFPSQVTTTAIRWKNKVIIPGVFKFFGIKI